MMASPETSTHEGRAMNRSDQAQADERPETGEATDEEMERMAAGADQPPDHRPWPWWRRWLPGPHLGRSEQPW